MTLDEFYRVVGWTVAASSLLALGLGGRSIVKASRQARREPETAQRSGTVALFWTPWSALLAVCLLLVLNQLLLGAHARAFHDGDIAFVADHFPRSWFEVDVESGVVRWLASWIGPYRRLSELSVLRINAFLEMPFALTAYLAIVFLFDPALHRAMSRSLLPALAAISFTVALCAAEVVFFNPWTSSDLVFRLLGALLVLLWLSVALWRARGREALGSWPRDPGPRDVLDLAAFVVGSGAVVVLVLAMFEVTLLYNSARLADRAFLVVISTVAGSISVVARALRTGVRHPLPDGFYALKTTRTFLAVFLVLFLVPSLPIRYGLGVVVSPIAAALLILASGGAALWINSRVARARREVVLWLSSLAIGAAAGFLVGCVGVSSCVPSSFLRFREGALMVSFVSFFVVFVIVGTIAERALKGQEVRLDG